MKKRRLKKMVLPTIYVMVVGVLFISISVLGSYLNKKMEYPNMSVSAIKKDDVTPVIKNEKVPTSSIVKPFTSNSVAIGKTFYDMNDDDTRQQNSLVYYEKTYLQNSGVLYVSMEQFDVVSAYDGTVTNISTDDILGNYVEITHNTNLKTIYYSLGEVTVQKDAKVKIGDIIGKSGENKLDTDKNNCLLFEVYHNGFAIDPEDFYNMNIEDLK